MSIQVANIDLSAAVVGTVGAIPLGQSMPPPTIAQQMQPQAMIVAQLVVFNESGCGLTLTFPVSRETLTCPAGGWRQIAVPPNEISLQYQVTYVLPNAPVSQLLVDLYLPGEAPDSIGTLGNSPIGVAGTVQTTTVNQVINTGQPAPTPVVEGQPSGAGASQLLLNNDGSGLLGGGNIAFNASGDFTSMPSDAIPVSAIGPGALDSDVTIGGGQVTSAVANATAATGASQLTGDATHHLIASWLAGSSRLQIGPDTNLFPQALALVYMDSGGTHRVGLVINADESGSVGGPFGLSLAWDSSGNLATIGGVAATGFGTPIIVAQALEVQVSDTLQHTIINYTPSVTGMYRVNATVGTTIGSVINPKLTVNAEGGDSLTSLSFAFPTAALSLMSGGSAGTFPTGNDFPMLPATFRAHGGNPIQVTFQNTDGGSGSFFVSIVIERLT